ncbi:hypothetical protein [Mucilaginibacter sp. UYCu711]|uniref:hypothetical protein n=1 Tax=Mucilaginibacter sp. UYCu711 TaxID=3156339 RepID=UPI003D230F10
MYLIGFIQTAKPLVLINPEMFREVTGLFNWINKFLNSSDFELDTPVTLENLTASLNKDVPVQINFNGYAVALLLGNDEVVQQHTERFVYTDKFELLKLADD